MSFSVLKCFFSTAWAINITDCDARPINKDTISFRNVPFVCVIRKGVRLKGINNLVKQTVVEPPEISIRYHENTSDIRIGFLQSMNNRGAGLIKISLTAVQKYLDPILYCVYDCSLNIRFLNLVTITVAEKESSVCF